MSKTGIVFLSLTLALAACIPSPAASPTPLPLASVAWVESPTSTTTPAPVPTPTQPVTESLFSKVSHSTDVLHLRCDPLEIIFDVTVQDPNVRGVLFFFRMKDKATGLVNGWSNGEQMRSVGNSMYEFNFRASAIPGDTKYWEAWVQYQFVAVNQNQQSIGRSQIFGEEITFTPKCR
jgi:hypothetical protein